eukprot:Sspe_Gene.45437::Locus_22496_Transcript_1_1_Confidence_1.000_Length_1275::g.45437::m.45437
MASTVQKYICHDCSMVLNSKKQADIHVGGQRHKNQILNLQRAGLLAGNIPVPWDGEMPTGPRPSRPRTRNKKRAERKDDSPDIVTQESTPSAPTLTTTPAIQHAIPLTLLPPSTEFPRAMPVMYPSTPHTDNASTPGSVDCKRQTSFQANLMSATRGGSGMLTTASEDTMTAHTVHTALTGGPSAHDLRTKGPFPGITPPSLPLPPATNQRPNAPCTLASMTTPITIQLFHVPPPTPTPASPLLTAMSCGSKEEKGLRLNTSDGIDETEYETEGEEDTDDEDEWSVLSGTRGALEASYDDYISRDDSDDSNSSFSPTLSRCNTSPACLRKPWRGKY